MQRLVKVTSNPTHIKQERSMELEMATIYDIADELANRGSQFIIAIQVIDNNAPFEIHLCVDGQKDKMEIAQVVAPLFQPTESEC
jgi:hypothetical protein